MITANEAREMAKNTRALEKEKTTQKVLEWCVTCGENITICAKKGYTDASFKLPLQFVGTFFKKEDLYLVIKEFYTSLGYWVGFSGNSVVLSWAW